MKYIIETKRVVENDVEYKIKTIKRPLIFKDTSNHKNHIIKKNTRDAQYLENIEYVSGRKLRTFKFEESEEWISQTLLKMWKIDFYHQAEKKRSETEGPHEVCLLSVQSHIISLK